MCIKRRGRDGWGAYTAKVSTATQHTVMDWVMNKVQEIQRCVGIECEGFEGKFMALLTAIEVGNIQIKKSG